MKMSARKLFWVGLACVALLAIVIRIMVPHTESDAGKCQPEVYRSVPVPSSHWVVESRGTFCGFGIAGGWDIRAHNTMTGEIILLAEGNGVLWTDALADGPNKITIQIRDSVEFLPIHDTFGAVQVNYQDTTSQDSPDVRAGYERWVHDRRAPANVRWYCSTILATLDKSNFDRFNQYLGEVYFPGSQPRLYCD